MPDKTWRVLREFSQSYLAAGEPVSPGELTAAVRELNLQPAFSERLAASLNEAVQQADPPVSVRVLVSGQAMPDTSLRDCWGYFLVEKRGEAGMGRQVELFLYPELPASRPDG